MPGIHMQNQYFIQFFFIDEPGNLTNISKS